jgi:hypothetical protein
VPLLLLLLLACAAADAAPLVRSPVLQARQECLFAAA